MEKVKQQDFIKWINSKNEHHRNHDLPAYVCKQIENTEFSYNPIMEWMMNNGSHRFKLPSIIDQKGLKIYYRRNIQYRNFLDGNFHLPSFVSRNGHSFWTDENGKYHREKLPAIITHIGERSYFCHGNEIRTH